ncbi:MAG TPA: alpha/beta hydrolase [Candidatus Omnitrophota bacterium]|jgi:fermentation-respiration switch protein FrsA (DUF1100 family)|nr:alpha/beta hydrolase [Candidatus Omnitrophota bacterium]
MLKAVLLIVVAFFSLFGYVRMTERRTVFLPSIMVDAFPSDAGLEFEDIFFETEDKVKLNGWLVKASQHPERAATLIFFHGNAGNISDRIERLKILHRIGINVFVIDYRGYGKSEGAPSEQGIYLDAQAAFDHIKARPDIRQDRIIAYGVSLGGAAAADLATKRHVNGLILESTFTSAPDMAKKILPIAPRFMVKTRMDTLSKIKRVTVPKLIIHSPFDELVPYKMALRLYDAAPAPKELLKISGTHNEGYSDSMETFEGGVRVFLKKYFSD